VTKLSDVGWRVKRAQRTAKRYQTVTSVHYTNKQRQPMIDSHACTLRPAMRTTRAKHPTDG